MKIKIMSSGVALLVATAITAMPRVSQAAPCNAEAHYVSAAPTDAKGLKQIVKFVVAAGGCGALCQGYVNYTLRWTDSQGAETTVAKIVSYKLSETGAVRVGGGTVVDDTILKAGACTEAAPCSIVGADVDKVTCRRADGRACEVRARAVENARGDAKGFKQNIKFWLQSADCGTSCEGYVTYTLRWKDKAGVVATDSKTVKYSLIPNTAFLALEVADDIYLKSGACNDGKPCKILGATIDKVSCRTAQ